jgi:5-methylcytosine-specific restriction enzyme B
MNDAELTLDNLAKTSVVPPVNFADQPQRVAEIADVPLDLPSVAEVIAAAKSWGFYDAAKIQEALISLTIGHVILGGPPGTGKTKLTAHLAAAFGVELLRETANAEWSVYDVIGTLSIGDNGQTKPKHGLVTNAILQCAATTVKHLDTGQGPQATWLLIDEINRAEIDRAFGSLFSALSGEDKGSYTLDYAADYPVLTLPRRFRLICTMNDYDTRFVNSMSSALRRRFARVLVLPPANVGGLIPEAELDIALGEARALAVTRLGTTQADQATTLLKTQATVLRQIFGAVRAVEDDIAGVPIGTAQIMDCCLYAIAYVSLIEQPSSEDGWWHALDRVVSTRLVSGLESDTTRLRIGDDYVVALAKKLPKLPTTCNRLREFLHGT